MTYLPTKFVAVSSALLLAITGFVSWPQQAVGGPLPPGKQVQRDIAYGPDPLERMDVYRPAHAKNAPVLLMVHGGGWWRGDKARAGVVDNKVAHWLPKGFIFISTNYRVIPKANPLEQAQDVAKALAFAQAHAKSWGGDPAHFILMGHSAGAHLVSLLSADPGIAKRQGAKPWLGTVSLDSAAYNVVAVMQRPHFTLYDNAFGTNQKLWREASPTLRLKPSVVPIMLVCSAGRKAARRSVDAFADKIQALHGRVVVLPVDMGHGEINAKLGLDNDYGLPHVWWARGDD